MVPHANLPRHLLQRKGRKSAFGWAFSLVAFAWTGLTWMPDSGFRPTFERRTEQAEAGLIFVKAGDADPR